MGHGGGGQLSAELIEHLFLPAFGNTQLNRLGDSAVLASPPGRLAFSTDSFVVRPLFFPGGSIGELAVNGTVNDLAMSGARPLWLSAAFVLEEGLLLATLGAIVERMAAAARAAGVAIVTGDTKVVERGHGDGCYINTSGIGVVPDGAEIDSALARPGDVVLVSGYLGDHGMAIMSVREGLAFESATGSAPIESDCAALHTLVAAMLAAAPGGVHVLRDPTRGGAAATLNEIAASTALGIALNDDAIPVRPTVRAACEMLGLDPLYVANEGKLLAIVAPEAEQAVLGAMRVHPLGRDARRMGTVQAAPQGMVTVRTGLGATRIVPVPLGEQLPRIC
ncbi:MAG: hydrogenase expression/formation protein HypE [Bryobacterales bacterium]|nr:hydrogenase expression/formation protein HypE [Bryobacterales bacterium]